MENLLSLELEQLIRKYNNAYRKGVSLITDIEFDQLVEKLKKLNPNANWFKKGIQDEADDRKEKLPIPMFSLEKIKSFEEFLKWVKSVDLQSTDELIITPKYDGISLCVLETVSAAWTRGDGEFGQNCSDSFALMQNSKIQISDEVEDILTISFGEAIFKTQDFLQIKKETDYKSARNAVAGLLNSPEENPLLKKINYVRYGCSEENLDKKDQLEILNSCSEEKNRVTFEVVRVKDLQNNFIPILNVLFECLTKGYKCDGLVIDINSAEHRKVLGRLPNGNPRYAIAYKNPEWSEREETIVKEVRWQISKDGRLAPVVEIESVELCGATVSRCTAYNARYVVENDIVPKARVVICRSGDVIPKHLKTISHITTDSKTPAVCPVCGKKLIWDSNNVDLICTNSQCEGVLLSKCVYFFSVLDFKEFREPTIKKIFNAGYKDPTSIIKLNEDQLKNIEGIGNIAAKVLSKQFEELRKKGTNFAKLTTAYNFFRGVIAEKTCQKILNGLKLYTYEDIFSFAKECDESWALDIEKDIEGVGLSTALAFVTGIADWQKSDSDTIPITYYGIEEKSFDGQMTVVFTGFRNKDWERKLIEMGHKTGSSVSKKTTCVVVKEKGSNSTKELKAESLGIPIFTVEEFREKFLM